MSHLQIEELRRERAEISQFVADMAAKEAAGEQLTAEEVATFQQKEKEFNEISAKMARLEAAERMAAAAAVPVSVQTIGAPAVVVKQEPQQYKGAGAVRIAMSMAAAKNDLPLAAKFAENEIGDKQVAMAVNSAADSGGALIPKNMSREVIELLRDRSIVRKLGARPIPLPNGNVTLPKSQGGAMANYIGEGQDIPTSESSFGDVDLHAKTLVTMVPISNQYIGYADYDVEQLILEDMLAAMAAREDKGFLRDKGDNKTPIGIRHMAEKSNRLIEWDATEITPETIDKFLRKLRLKLITSNSPMINPAWGMSAVMWSLLDGLRDNHGSAFYPEMAKGKLLGMPFEYTNSIPLNLGTSGNGTEIYLADFHDIVIGEHKGMSVEFSKEASYVTPDGKLVSAFSRNQSLIRIITEHDIGYRHSESLAVGIEVPWE